jgi:hypothetical protein
VDAEPVSITGGSASLSVRRYERENYRKKEGKKVRKDLILGDPWND